MFLSDEKAIVGSSACPSFDQHTLLQFLQPVEDEVDS
jgi:hypothetical protein